jgi:CheY-like chemotaxis protein/HPt (histidine-containing phosphotransfer) domain-containing protein
MLTVNVERETEEAVVIKFTVTDNGIGIAEKNIDKVFSPFVQADSSISRCYGGSGLGLAIANKLVALMGWNKIYIESSVGAGSVFWFAAEFKKAGVKNTGADINKTVSNGGFTTKKNLDILLVEDNFFNIQLVQKFLTSIGHTVDPAESGEKALEMIALKKYDAVIMDIQMPEMDGIETTIIMRRSGVTVPIIAITADATQKNYERCIEAGMNSYITKPLNIDELEAAIANSTTGRSAFFKPDEPLKDPQIQIFNFEKLNNNFTGISGSMEKFVKLFISNGGRYVDEIKAAAAEKDPEKLKFTAHKLKGTALNACAEKIAFVFRTLEDCGEEPEGFEKADILIKCLPLEFELYRQRALEYFPGI